MNCKHIPVLLCLLVLTGCQAVNYKERFEQASVCCERISDIKYKPVTYEEPLIVEIGAEKSQIRDFEGGHSFFLPVELPRYEGPFEIILISKNTGNQIFVPSVILLDDKFIETGKVGPKHFNYSNGALIGNFFITADHRETRYMVIYTSIESLKKSYQNVSVDANVIPIVAGNFIIHYTHHNERSNVISAAPGGNIQVTLKRYAPRSISRKD